MSVRAQIKYLLSEDGRRDSLRRGGNGRRVQEVTGPIDPTDVDAFTVDDEGEARFDATQDFCPFNEDDLPVVNLDLANWVCDAGVCHVEWSVSPDWEDLLDLARSFLQYHNAATVAAERYEQRKAEAAKTFLSTRDARATKIERDYVLFDSYRYDEFHAVTIEARRRQAEDQENLREENRGQLREWIARHGTDNQRQRLIAGLLPWQEAYDAAAEFLYRPLAEFPSYERFDPEQVCRCIRDFVPCKVKFQSVDATELTAEEWDQFSKIQAAVGGATFQVREHRARCESGAEEMRRGVIVKFALHRLGFKREFALTGAAS